MHQLYASSKITGMFRPPGRRQNVMRIAYPLWTRDAIAMAKKLHRGRAEGSPTAGMLGANLWFRYRIAHQNQPIVLCVAVPGVPEVAQRNPGFLSRTNLLIGSRH